MVMPPNSLTIPYLLSSHSFSKNKIRRSTDNLEKTMIKLCIECKNAANRSANIKANKLTVK